jgi:hypothetical protein
MIDFNFSIQRIALGLIIFFIPCTAHSEETKKREKSFSNWTIPAQTVSIKSKTLKRYIDGPPESISLSIEAAGYFRIAEEFVFKKYVIKKGEVFFATDSKSDIICDLKTLWNKSEKITEKSYRQICFVDNNSDGNFESFRIRKVGSFQNKDDFKLKSVDKSVSLFEKISRNEIDNNLIPSIKINYVDHFNIGSNHEFILDVMYETVVYCDFRRYAKESRFHIKDNNLKINLFGVDFIIENMGQNQISVSWSGSILKDNINCF